MPSFKSVSKRFVSIVPWLILTLGIVLRTSIWLQNRNLIIDEANVARNLYERSFGGLLHSLDYEQFAPPIFLWISKCSMLLWGAGEQSLRFFPYICSIVNLYLIYLLFRKLNIWQALFYPLLLFATGMIYLRYATELKQYSSDITVTLALVLLALKFGIQSVSPLKLGLIWLFAGSVSIWLSMPSVFILAGVAAYYGLQLVQQKARKAIIPFMAIGLIWAVQFLAYYLMLLRASTQSDYLQEFHFQYVLIFPPSSVADWQHNAAALAGFFNQLGGHWVLSFSFNLLLVVIGFRRLWSFGLAIFSLFCLPILLLLVAVAMHQFTLLDRVCSFIYPLLLALLGLGLEYLLQFRFRKFTLIPVLLICIVNLVNFNKIKWLWESPVYDQTIDASKWILQHTPPIEKIVVHPLCQPEMIYYTQIHPNAAQFAKLMPFLDLKEADALHKLPLTTKLRSKVALMYGYIGTEELQSGRQYLEQYFQYQDSFISKSQLVYLLERK